MATNFKPRLCHVTRGANGYGFHLHGEKGKFGQCIRKVEPDSPAEHSGLKTGDRIVEVNGKNIENESHTQVVARIKEKSGETSLLVVDEESDKYFRENNISITEELLKSVIPNVDEPSPNTEMPPPPSADELKMEADDSVRPRLCHLERSETKGYGFNLHSEKGKEGRYIRSVDDDSPSFDAGMRSGDRIIEVNGKNMEYHKHGEVVAAIKESGNKVDLLVVDEKADNFFKSLKVTPTADHVTGPLPTAQTAQEPEPPAPAYESASTLKEYPEEPAVTPKPESEDPPQTNGKADLLSMDLQSLKQMSRPRPKKTAPSSNWNNRQAIFNNL